MSNANVPAGHRANGAADHDAGSVFYVFLLAGTAALGGLLFGYDTAVIAGAIGYLKTFMHLTDNGEGWAVANVLLGCAIGAAFIGPLADRFGRKRMLVLTAILFAVSAVTSALPNTLWPFVAARMLGGLAVGAAALLSPAYIAEVAPARMRGSLVTLCQIAIISGMVVVSIVNWQIARAGDEAWNVAMGWRWMFASETLPAVFFLVCLLFVPESPRWLVKRGRVDEARAVLARISGTAEAEQEIAEIQQAMQVEQGTWRELLSPGYRKILLLAITLAVLQQVTGINAIVYYTPKIFASAGTGDTSALLRTAAMQGVNLAVTVVALLVIDRLGRKPLLLCTSAAMFVALVFLAVMFWKQPSPNLVFFGVLAYIAAFAIGMGPVVWVVLAEIFPNRTRGLAMGAATVALWLADFLVSQTAPMLYERTGMSTAFALYAIMCVVSFVVVARFLPETRGKSLEEIERELVFSRE
ncbi:MAG: MFS transporter [Planctomycetota bacterium]|nr:MAG: MFS transporter [Planctomycetota bacterium]